MNTSAATARCEAIRVKLLNARGRDPQQHLDLERVEELKDELDEIEAALESAADEAREDRE